MRGRETDRQTDRQRKIYPLTYGYNRKMKIHFSSVSLVTMTTKSLGMVGVQDRPKGNHQFRLIPIFPIWYQNQSIINGSPNSSDISTS